MMESIRGTWAARASQRLARGAGVRESFLEQLHRFFDALVHSLDTGEPAWVERVIDSWIGVLTESELAGETASLTRMLSELLLETRQIVTEMFSDAEALELLAALVPLFTFSYEYATRRDIEVRVRHVQAELEAASMRLEQLDRSKSDFISVAAHELKTPLTLIEGYTAMLREHLAEQVGEPYTENLFTGIDQGSRRLREIIDDMIDVSLLDNNLLSLNFQPLWISRILEALQIDLEETITGRRQELSLESFPGIGEMTFGDPERLYQAFRNVLINAIKYTPDGGAIRIGGRKLPGFLEITVTDTGIGINPENHTRIFEKFSQTGNVSLHSSGKTKYKGGGPGLGLPITKGLIEAHGGTIWVESERQDENELPGSVFHIMLPLRKEPPDERSERLFQSIMDGYQNE